MTMYSVSFSMYSNLSFTQLFNDSNDLKLSKKLKVYLYYVLVEKADLRVIQVRKTN